MGEGGHKGCALLLLGAHLMGMSPTHPRCARELGRSSLAQALGEDTWMSPTTSSDTQFPFTRSRCHVRGSGRRGSFISSPQATSLQEREDMGVSVLLQTHWSCGHTIQGLLGSGQTGGPHSQTPVLRFSLPQFPHSEGKSSFYPSCCQNPGLEHCGPAPISTVFSTLWPLSLSHPLTPATGERGVGILGNSSQSLASGHTHPSHSLP